MSKKTSDDLKLAARLVVHGWPEMSETQRRWIVKWLRDQALSLNSDERHGRRYGKRYVARHFN